MGDLGIVGKLEIFQINRVEVPLGVLAVIQSHEECAGVLPDQRQRYESEH